MPSDEGARTPKPSPERKDLGDMISSLAHTRVSARPPLHGNTENDHSASALGLIDQAFAAT
jgi:hypothetical protein